MLLKVRINPYSTQLLNKIGYFCSLSVITLNKIAKVKKLYNTTLFYFY